MKRLAELHLHTQYSFLDGIGTPEEYIKRAKQLEMVAISCTDHGTTCGLFHFYEACKKEDIKPILGIEFYCTKDFNKKEIDIRTGKETVKRYHLVALAKNNKGYQNLIKLSSLAYNTFYKKPILELKTLLENKEGLIILSACIGSIIQTEEDIKLFKTEFNEDFYLEIQPLLLDKDWNFKSNKYEQLDYNRQFVYNKKVIEFSKKFNIKIVVTLDVHYPNKEDKLIQDIFILNSPYGKNGWCFSSDNHYLMNAEQVWEELKKYNYNTLLTYEEYQNTLKNIEEIVNKVESYDLEQPTTFLNFPYHTHPLYTENDDAEKLILKIIKNNNKLPNEQNYYVRLNKELKIIKQKGFLDYFLVVEDIVRYAKQNNILMGPGRGSAAGSLLSFCLDITKLDPIKYQLSFERFLDYTRENYPDIDMDFEDQDKIVAYLEQKYGKDRITRLGVYQTVKIKTAIKDAYRILRKDSYDFTYINNITRDIPNSISQETEKKWFEDYIKQLQKNDENNILLKFIGLNGDIYNAAMRMVDKVKLIKKHPCATVISPTPLTDIIPIIVNSPNTAKAYTLSAYNGEYVEKSGLIKFDVLSLNTLKDIHQCLNLIKQRKNIDIDIYKLEPTDFNVLTKFTKDNVDTIFQFDTYTATNILNDIRIRTFDDLSDATALGRPGPIEANLVKEYVDRKLQRKQKNLDHPILNEILKGTQGTCIYQEQVMEIFQKIGGFTPAETNQIRKMISKSENKDKTEQIKEKFFTYATTLLEPKMSTEEAELLFNDMIKFADYCFNKSHSMSYAYVSYICQYLKTYYSTEWWASVLQNSDEEDLKRFFNHKKDIISLPDINLSKHDFVFGNNDTLVMPLKYIQSLGPSAINEITSKQPYDNFNDFFNKVNKSKVKKNIVENLILANVFTSIEPNKSNYDLIVEYYNLRKDDLPEIYKTINDKYMLEKLQSKVFCFNQTSWIEKHPELFDKNVQKDLELVKKMYSRKVIVGGIIYSIEECTAKNGKKSKYYKFNIENNSSTIKVFCWQHPMKLPSDGSLVEIQGEVTKYGLTMSKIKQIEI